MGKFVTPKVYLIGCTGIIHKGLTDYLADSGNEEFLESIASARVAGLSDGEILCSFYAKLSYASHVVGHNKNVSRVRGIHDNIRNCFDQAHLSVFEHCNLNFVVRNCSRVYCMEQIRHRAGFAYSQTSGRYVRGEVVDIVWDPILEPVRKLAEDFLAEIEDSYLLMVDQLGLDQEKDFDRKKKLTSALRRFLPNGQANDLGFSVNLRALRHTVMMRTSKHAETEIRAIYEQVYNLVKERYPLVFHGAREEVVDGIVEVSGMRMQPYEKVEGP